jgi:hypothetical protein
MPSGSEILPSEIFPPNGSEILPTNILRMLLPPQNVRPSTEEKEMKVKKVHTSIHSIAIVHYMS